MIKINKPALIPEMLKKKGITLNAENCNLFDADSTHYRSGILTFDIKPSVYGHKTVKTALQEAQHGKCCYCESQFSGTSYGAVEHYRPKSVAYQDEARLCLYPGYYWLGYDWSNLLFICTVCNTIKSAFFPLKNPADRTIDHNGSIANEEPLIINPAVVDPIHHITYHYDLPLGITEEGKATVRVLQLETRPGLVEDRLEALNTFNLISELTESVFNVDDNKHLDGIKLIRRFLSPTSRFSAMLNANFADRAANPAFALL